MTLSETESLAEKVKVAFSSPITFASVSSSVVITALISLLVSSIVTLTVAVSSLYPSLTVRVTV